MVTEQMIGDLCAADPMFNAACLRYFNPWARILPA
jgi:UDP-glucose 4-epimerase